MIDLSKKYVLTPCLLLLLVVFALPAGVITAAAENNASNPLATPNQLTATLVTIRLIPSVDSCIVDSTFNVDIQVEAGTQPVAGIDAFINFDPDYLEATLITPNTGGLGITANKRIDNTNGYADYSALKSAIQPFPTGTFSLATVTFRCQAPLQAAAISFNAQTPRKSQAAYNGDGVLGGTEGCTIDLTYDVPLQLEPTSNPGKVAGQQFSIALKVNAGTGQNVAGADAFIDFDPAYLETVTVKPNTAALGIVAKNQKDNINGQINYSALRSGGQPFPSGTFTMATVTFRAKQPVDSTIVTFSLDGNRTSKIAYEGDIIYGPHNDATVQITDGARIRGAVTMQGGNRPLDGLYVPLTLKLFTSDKTINTNNILTAQADFQMSVSSQNLAITNTDLDTKTIAFESAPIILPGTYHIAISSPHCLINLKKSIAVADGTEVNMGILQEGNADDNVQIAGADFSLLLNDYLQATGSAKWNNGRCDFDRDGQVTTVDYSLMAQNYNKVSPQTVQ